MRPPLRSVAHTARDAHPASDGSVEREPEQMDEMVRRAADGDGEAVAWLVEATHRDAYGLAWRLTGNAEDARDVTQEAYLRAYRGLPRFRGDAQFGTWLHRIVVNCAATHMGRSRRHRHEELPDAALLGDPSTELHPDLRAEATDLRDRVVAALDVLPPKLRAVVVLRDVYEMSHEDIAAELGISVTAAKVRLHRARHRLRTEVFPELDEVRSRAV